MSRHFGPRTLQTRDMSAPSDCAEVPGQFDTSAEVSRRHYTELSRPAANIFGTVLV